mmetsp:Transcript_10261/g.24093  ORF Transcript_10261/g.24093 Transcript_10261/m.24093 type:complete len:210 (+) Transcript_10261:1954-2583(+)
MKVKRPDKKQKICHCHFWRAADTGHVEKKRLPRLDVSTMLVRTASHRRSRKSDIPSAFIRPRSSRRSSILGPTGNPKDVTAHSDTSIDPTEPTRTSSGSEPVRRTMATMRLGPPAPGAGVSPSRALCAAAGVAPSWFTSPPPPPAAAAAAPPLEAPGSACWRASAACTTGPRALTRASRRPRGPRRGSADRRRRASPRGLRPLPPLSRA